MTGILVVFLFIINIIHLSCELNSDTHSKHPRYEFILHKCTASVQFNRKHQNEEKSNMNLNKRSFTMQDENSTSPQIHPATDSANSKLNNDDAFNNYSETNNMSIKRLFMERIAKARL
ncbi:unnamed protein product [Xylocopa violacea]|uniref:Uncharacterized protein n=1 Tax=Xylocopa violacea TaxID=135666 RepID=A0ABP1NSF7_XYLVO